MRPIAIVIPWFGADLTGGAEQQAFQVATRLAARGHNVEVLSTCNRSFHSDWAINHYAPGVIYEHGLKVRRFLVDPRDDVTFGHVNDRLLAVDPSDFRAGVNPVTDEEAHTFVHENIKSAALLGYLRDEGDAYHAFIFLPYLFGPTTLGAPLVADRAWLQPCLHDEAYAYLPQTAELFRCAHALLFNSEGEMELALRLYGPGIYSRSAIIGEGIERPQYDDDTLAAALPAELRGAPFVLYLGRREPLKNVDLLARAFLQFKSSHPTSKLQLVLAGPGQESFGASIGIHDLGLVADEVKAALLAKCRALAQPSRNESFSRVIMEAWAAGRPVAVNRECPATAIAVQRSRGGWTAATEAEWADFFAGIAAITDKELGELGARGRRYAATHAEWDTVIARYESSLGLAPRQRSGRLEPNVMNKVAIVVQRCHESIVGGSESLAWQYATLLKEGYEVEVLTTTAVDADHWSNVLPEGIEVRDDINIRRFHVDIGYSPYRTELFVRMLQDFDRLGVGKHGAMGGGTRSFPWSIALQEELVRRIGPHSESLVQYVRQNWSSYRAIIVVTYLYPTAYFSLLEIPKGRALFAPTLHDEPPAYLSIYQHAARRAHSLIWLTEAERRLGTDLWGELPGRIVAMAIDAEPREPAQLKGPYLLYCGRIDPNKGCATLFDYFTRFKAKSPSELRLVLTGQDDMPIPDHADIDFRGFVSAEEKFSLMSGAQVYLMPSAKESFSIVAMEAMAQRTPVLASGESEVLADHIAESGGGSIYHDYESFAARLNEMLASQSMREQMGERGRNYVISRFVSERVRQSLVEAIESCPQPDVSVVPVSYFPDTPITIAAVTHSTNGKNTSDEATLADISRSPPLPLPPGWSEEDLRRMISSVQVEDASLEELRPYVEADFKRFVYTLSLVPEQTGQRILELGANPYFTTTLLRKFRSADLHLANFFDKPGREGKQKVTIHSTGEVIEYAFQQFNIEAEKFPYDDNSFDVVLFCEIIEHLLTDPVHALTEIRRVLKPGGDLVLTTPNVARLENARKIIAGENVYDPYSGHGPYGRHNREYTQEDLFSLLTANGFTVRTIFTADVHPEPAGSSVSLRALAPLLRNRQTDLGQYIFCQCSVNSESKQLTSDRPSWLYRNRPNSNEK
jgi:glycosyltransferase involved in cell wall biosynthesis/SAM-dependent methyltransferase